MPHFPTHVQIFVKEARAQNNEYARISSEKRPVVRFFKAERRSIFL